MTTKKSPRRTRVQANFRLDLETYYALAKMARKAKTTKTEMVVSLIQKAAG